MSKICEDLKLPVGCAEELISRVVGEVVSERAWGWHLAVSPVRLRELALSFYEDLTPCLCAECVLPGCCYFDIVRLTSSDVLRLSRRLKQSQAEFVAEHCAPHVDASDRGYVWKLKRAKPCQFLGQDSRCRVYADRPAVCVEFPFVADKKTGDLTEIRLFPFCNVAFNVVRCEVARRVENSLRTA
jgi:Fe-S-cluster containining protein